MDALPPARVTEPTDVLAKRVGALVVDEALYVAAVAVATVVLPGSIGLSPFLVSVALVWALQFVVLQGLVGATPGKLLAGLRVVDGYGDTIGLGPAFVRSAAFLVDGFPYVIPITGAAAAASDADGQRFGDRWARTYVVALDDVGHPPFALIHPADGGPAYQLATGNGAPAVGGGETHHGPQPVYDRELQAYTRWDPGRGAWLVFDEAGRRWDPVEARQ